MSFDDTAEKKALEYADCRDKDGNFIKCPICGSSEHTDGRCEQMEEDYREYSL